MEDLNVQNNSELRYKEIRLKDLELDIIDTSTLTPDERAHVRSRGNLVHGGQAVSGIIIDGKSIRPTGRFWESLYSRYSLNTAFFKFFSMAEVLKRIGQRERPDELLRVCIERNANTGDERLLSVTSPKKSLVVYDDLMDVLKKYGGTQVRYNNGMVESTHTPPGGTDNKFQIAGDNFSYQYKLMTPVDGYGNANIYLSLLRWVCSNGAVGFADSFKTALTLGKGEGIKYSLERALESFSNDEGYAVMRDRFSAASRSWASIREQQQLYKTLLRIQGDKELASKVEQMRTDPSVKLPGAQAADAELGVANVVLKAFDRVSGNPFDLYHADPNMLSAKRKSVLPVSCKVYDMLNFATELATHHVTPESSRMLQGWVGEMLSNEYDLEGSCDTFDQMRDVFLPQLRSPESKK